MKIKIKWTRVVYITGVVALIIGALDHLRIPAGWLISIVILIIRGVKKP